MKNACLLIMLLSASIGLANTEPNQRPRFRVLAFYSTTVEPDHLQFAEDAVKFFSALADKNKFAFDTATDWAQLNDSNLKRYQVVIWLNESPTKEDQRLAFQHFVEGGGAWLGFHAAGYNDKDTDWPWFVDFLGGAVFHINSWPPLPARLTIDDHLHAVNAHLPDTYLSPDNEWYVWKPSPRLNRDVRVLVTLDPSNYPLGLKDVITQGDLPVVWTNTKYRMVYMNMGHGGKIFDSPVQNELIENATLWLGESASEMRALSSTLPAAGVQINPRGIAISPETHKVYVVNAGSGTVTIVGKDTRLTVKVGAEPGAIAINPKTDKIYVGNAGSGTVTVIDGVSDKVTANVEVGDLPYVIAVNPSTNKVYVSKTFSNTITVIDGATNATRILKAGVQADAIGVNPLTNKLYLTSYQSKDVTTIDGVTDGIGRVPTSMHIWGIAVNLATNKIYLANSGDARLAVIDGASGAVTQVSTGEFPCAVAVDEAANRVYVVNYSSGTVTVIDGATNSIMATVKVGERPQALAVNSHTHRIYVANTHSNSVSVIDGASHSVVATINTGKGPYAVAVDRTTNKAYVANIGGDPLTVIDGN